MAINLQTLPSNRGEDTNSLTELTKGNYKSKAKKKQVKPEKKEVAPEFETRVLENLGGSIAFVRPKKGEPLIE